MAKAGLAHDQTVEEILASIRRVISGDQSQRGDAHAAGANGAAATHTAAVNGAPAHATNGATAAPNGAAVPHDVAIQIQADDTEDEAPVARRATIVTAIAGGKASGPRPVPQDIESVEFADGFSADADDSEIHSGVELAIEQALDSVDPDDIRAETAGPEDAREREPAVMAQPTASVIAMPPPRAAERSFAPAAAVNAPAMNGHGQRPPNAPVPDAQQPESAHATTAEPVGSEAQAFASVGLLSPQANAAVAASFESLAHEIAAKGMRDLDHTVESMLRPMLRDWLEANLPGMVERMVREEIERVSRGKR